MKKILHIGTGGTISSQNSGEGLSPAIAAQELLKYCPDIKNICEFDVNELFDEAYDFCVIIN